MQQSAVGGEIDQRFGGGLLLGRRRRARPDHGLQPARGAGRGRGRSGSGSGHRRRSPLGTTTTGWPVLFLRAEAVLVHDLLLQDVHVVDVLEEGLVRGQHLDRLDVLLELLHVALELRAPILEPGYNLRSGEKEFVSSSC